MIRSKINNLINKERGFTIVELLIVIVVIGILAAITIVSYTGITQQATLAQYKQDASSIVNVGEVVYNSTNSYPVAVAGFANSTAKLPSNVTLGATALSADPADAAAVAVTTTNGVKTYVWQSCGASTGFVVYYPDPSVTGPIAGVGQLSAGAGC